MGIVFPEWGWSKSGAILPVKINGKYIMYFGDSNIWIAYSEDMIHWVTSKDWVVLKPRPGYFDSKLVEPGPPPILTDEGVLLIYNGADERNRYSVGWVLFSKDDPTRVIARAEKPILEPKLEWEIHGQVPNVVFATSLVKINGKWYLYYGAADTYIGLAIANMTTNTTTIILTAGPNTKTITTTLTTTTTQVVIKEVDLLKAGVWLALGLILGIELTLILLKRRSQT